MNNQVRGATVEVLCKCCRQPFTARVADRKRGWGKFCSKSCKARSTPLPVVRPELVAQKTKTKTPPAWIRGVLAGAMFKPTTRDQYDEMHEAACDGMEDGWDGHK